MATISPTVRTVHCGVYDTLADWEAALAIAQLHSGAFQPGGGSFRVVTVGETGEPVTTLGGVRIVPDIALAELRPDDSAMLVLPGADTWFGGNGGFLDAARTFLDSGVPVAAICGATYGLATVGLLDDRDHTSNAPEFLARSGYAGAERYRHEPAVTDGDLITATGVAPVDFARAIFAHLDVYPPPVLDAWYRLYHDGDAAAWAELMAATS